MVLEESVQELERGDAAPNFALPGTDGEEYSLADFADYEALLLVFTCNHCPYAKAKFDLLNEIAAAYDEVAVVGINPNDAEEYPEDSFDRMVELVEDGTIRYDAYLRDESQAVARDYGAVCTPDPYLFGRREGSGERRASGSASGDGQRAEFRLAYHGRLDDALNPDAEPTELYVREAIDAVLAGEDVALDFMPSRGCSIKWRD
ncbi:thioredoxin family protein [Halomarina halobia]|uniref:Thioredoxin family protein n=1 Tax=Halomarina halobia TaxID=3033386 RepID=A0ABD6A694_9EURY|nr:thioredoxin family protein [Halomarina sp. PSR21]